MDKQQKDRILQFFEKYSFDITMPLEKQPQIERYIQELGKNIIDYKKDNVGSDSIIILNKRFFKQEYKPSLDISEIYGDMIKQMRETSRDDITIKSGKYELYIPNNSRLNHTLSIKKKNLFGGQDTTEFDNPYDAGKEFAETVGINMFKGLFSIPSISEILNMFKSE